MRSEQQVLNRIKEILKDEPKGMSITEISAKINLNRNSVAKYINMLQISGQVEMQTRAAAKIFYLARRLPIAEIVSVSSDAVILVDEALHVVQTNDAVLTLLNLTHEDSKSQSVLDLITPIEGLEGALAHLKQALAGEKTETEITLQADKEDCCFRVQFIPILFEDGANGVALVFADISGQQKMEKALEESDERYRDLYENSPIANFSISTDGRIRRCNRHAAEMLGYTVEELVGRPVFELYADAPEGKTRAREVFERFLQSRAIHDEELLMRKADGSPLWVYLTMNAVRDAQGNLVESRSTVVDITERKNAERELEKYRAHLEELVAERTADLQRSEERLRMALEGANDGLWDWEVDTGKAYLSPRYYTMLGYEPGEFPPSYEAWESRVHPDDLAAALQNLNDHTAGKNPQYETTFRMRARSGEYRWILSRGRVTERDDEGRAQRIVGTHTDITDQKQAEEELRRAEEEKQQILDSAVELFGYYDTDLRVLWCNQATADSVGLAKDELIGRHCYEVRHQRGEPCEGCPLMRVLETGEAHDAEIETPDGRTMFIRGQPIFDEEGNITSLMKFSYDITKRKQTEEALQAANAYNRSLIEASLDPLVTINPEGRITDVNTATEAVTGYSRDALIGTDFSDYYTDPAMARAGYLQVFEDGQVRDYPLEIKHRDGTATPVLYNATVYRDEQGNIAGVFAAARDVTEQQRMQQKLQENEAQLAEREHLLNKIFEILPIGVWLADREGRLIMGNPAGKRIWGAEPLVPPEEYGVFRARRLPSGEAVAADDWALVHTIKQGVTVADEILEIDAFDGKKRIIVNYTTPIIGEDGGIEGAVIVNHDITDRWLAERALQESEESYRTIIETASEGIWEQDSQHITLRVNPTMAAMLGYHVDEMIGRPVQEFLFEEDIRELRTALQAQRQEGLRGMYECRLKHKDGTARWVLVSATPKRDKDGTLAGSFAMFTDITERKRAEDALRQHTEDLARLNRQLAESRKQYRCLVEHAPDMIAIHDGDQYIYVNPAGMQLLHVEDPADIIGKSVMIFLHHDYRDVVRTRIEQMKQMAVKVPVIEEKLLTLDGKIVDVEVAAHPFSSQGKRLIHLIARDISQRKRAEDALRESEERFRYITEHSPDIIYMLDREGRFTYVSPSTERITGYTQEEMLEQSFMDYIPESEVPKAYRAQKKVLEGEELLQLQLHFIRKNGEAVPLECNVSPAYKNGIVVGSQGIARDITRRE
ncbi:hypothetical protein ABH15_12375 [Methanoculleus taiwanensis]|uniref:histidine kinase n=1 Tax=Methanoculleus taiwanensis TaxID=1550565 RepID=A0A498GYK3_9EURY|nr:PAS domain S-box protein [Methanoculleus taiwanensis]RXE55503.1 hypothetical protein ABH15_12375 [Methanoculleus taiwanensis]